MAGKLHYIRIDRLARLLKAFLLKGETFLCMPAVLRICPLFTQEFILKNTESFPQGALQNNHHMWRKTGCGFILID